MQTQPCDHTLRFTKQYLANHIFIKKQDLVIFEMKEMGGYCDCEVLMNCYESYFD